MRWRVYCRASCSSCPALQAEESDPRNGTVPTWLFSLGPLISPVQVETVTGMFPDIPQYGHPPCVRVRSCDLLSFAVPISITIFSARVQSNSQPTRSSSAGSLIPYAPPRPLTSTPSHSPSTAPRSLFYALPPPIQRKWGSTCGSANHGAHRHWSCAPYTIQRDFDFSLRT